MDDFYVLGVDQSTQGTKAVLFDRDGKLVERYDLPHRQIISDEGWVSHDPAEICGNVVKACRNVIEKAGIDRSAVRCMGITNQRETSVVWDRKTGEPLADAIVWHCNRATEICEQIDEKYHCADLIYEKTGLKLSPYYPASKYAWFLQNIPGVKEKAEAKEAAFGTIDSWVIFKLTGGKRFVSDASNSARTQLFALKEMAWDREICGYFGIDPDLLPEVLDSDAEFGETDLEGFLEKPIPIHGVLGDSNGALFGHNCRQAGKIKTTYGTGSSVMMNIGGQPTQSRHGLSTSVAWKIGGETTYVFEGNINYTGAVITWLKDEGGLISSAGETEELAFAANQEDRTYIVPAFSGLGAPWWKSDARAMIFGMNRGTGRKELVKAACECIAYQINDLVDAMRADTGLEVPELNVDGGPTRNRYLMQFQSDMSRVQINSPNAEELSVIGVSYLAGISAGLYDSETVYNAREYHHYHPEMDEKSRKIRLDGWKEAIQTVCS